ncbi:MULTISPECIES: hypothetical protein [Streptomyces]|uniref:Transposase n=1 Tax=Streptomyces lienomycini TaxID=284035 RepID=A0ABV9X4P1_9ACTN|nr:hypothetical protein [Streptomyces sp. NBC_00334]
MVEPYLRWVTCQQYFFANLQRPKNGGPRGGKAGRRVLKPPPVPEPHHVIATSTQLTLFTAPRDFRRFDRELHADLANPLAGPGPAGVRRPMIDLAPAKDRL